MDLKKILKTKRKTMTPWSRERIEDAKEDEEEDEDADDGYYYHS